MAFENGAALEDCRTVVIVPSHRIKIKGRGLKPRTIEVLVW